MPTIKELYNNRQIRTWSYNVCEKAGILNTEQLIAHYKLHGSFRNLPNCGRLLSRELEFACDYYAGILELKKTDNDTLIQYADFNSGKRAFDLGHIDVLMVVADKTKKYALNHQELRGKVGWCIGEKTALNSI